MNTIHFGSAGSCQFLPVHAQELQFQDLPLLGVAIWELPLLGVAIWELPLLGVAIWESPTFKIGNFWEWQLPY